jgi:hypothetical protein
LEGVGDLTERQGTRGQGDEVPREGCVDVIVRKSLSGDEAAPWLETKNNHGSFTALRFVQDDRVLERVRIRRTPPTAFSE